MNSQTRNVPFSKVCRHTSDVGQVHAALAYYFDYKEKIGASFADEDKVVAEHDGRIQQWLEGPEGERGLKLTKVDELLTRRGVDVSYSSVYRWH